MSTILCNSLEKYVTRLYNHRCYQKPAPWQGPGQSGDLRLKRDFSLHDNPMNRTLGFVCADCKIEFAITLATLRNSMPNKNWLEILRTVDGREQFARMISDMPVEKTSRFGFLRDKK